jgi:hypothetical protein
MAHLTPPAAPAAQDSQACGPCCGKDPAAQASATQGISPANPGNPYIGKEAYANVAIDEGTVFYSLTPGATPGFAVLESTLRDAGGSWGKYDDPVQVTIDPGKDPEGRPRKLPVLHAGTARAIVDALAISVFIFSAGSRVSRTTGEAES